MASLSSTLFAFINAATFFIAFELGSIKNLYLNTYDGQLSTNLAELQQQADPSTLLEPTTSRVWHPNTKSFTLEPRKIPLNNAPRIFHCALIL